MILESHSEWRRILLAPAAESVLRCIHALVPRGLESFMRPLRILFLSVLVTGLVVSSVLAGTLCGTVRDAQTLNPVPAAGIFLYQSNVYTGLNTASDNAGQYCLSAVPSGTYDIEVRVDDYQTAWVTGVEVPDDATAVDLFSSVPAELDAPWPNPSGSQVFFRYRLGTTVPVRLLVYDVRGRVIRGWAGRGGTGETELRWDFRDDTGHPVASGLYFVQLHAGERVLTRRLVRIR